MPATYNVGIIGGGFVGSAVAFGFGSSNSHDFNVRVYDVDPDRSSHTFEETISESDFIFLCLPTPSKADMSIDLSYVEDVMEKNKFGDAGNEVLIEECLFGTELSYMGIMTPKGFYPFETSVDYKPLLDGNRGPNTGGMGCMSPSPFMNNELLKNINEQVVEPTAHGLRKAKIDFYGFMYFGLMVKDNQPKVLEYNCRLGDPETQCLMLQLESDILEVLLDALSDNLENILWSKESSMGVVIASGGYPESYKKDQHIEILDLNEVQLFHAGTKKENGDIYAIGGRVLNFVSTSNNLKETRNNIFNLIKKLNWKNGFYRKDIGYKVID